MHGIYQNLPYYLIMGLPALAPGGWPYAVLFILIALVSDTLLSGPRSQATKPLMWWRRRTVAEVVTHTTRRLMRGVR